MTDLIGSLAAATTVSAGVIGLGALIGKWILQRFLRLWAEGRMALEATPWDHPRRSWFRPRTRASILWLLLRPDQRARAPHMSSLAMSQEADDSKMHPDEKLMARTARSLAEIRASQRRVLHDIRGDKIAPSTPGRCRRRTVAEWDKRGHAMSHAVSWRHFSHSRFRWHQLDLEREIPDQRCICGAGAHAVAFSLDDEFYEEVRCDASALVLWRLDLSDRQCGVRPGETPMYSSCRCGALIHALHATQGNELWMRSPLGDGRCQPHLRCSRSGKPLGGPTPRQR